LAAGFGGILFEPDTKKNRRSWFCDAPRLVHVAEDVAPLLYFVTPAVAGGWLVNSPSRTTANAYCSTHGLKAGHCVGTPLAIAYVEGETQIDLSGFDGTQPVYRMTGVLGFFVGEREGRRVGTRVGSLGSWWAPQWAAWAGGWAPPLLASSSWAKR
jgi:hypothetical protein